MYGLKKWVFNTFSPLTVIRDERNNTSVSENMFRNHERDMYNYMDIIYTFLGKLILYVYR